MSLKNGPTGKTNYAVTGGGGTLDEYRADIEYEIEHGWCHRCRYL
jgi:hypothetical protein